MAGVSPVLNRLCAVSGIIHRERDVARSGVLPVGDRVGEAGRPGVAGGRHKADGLRAGIVADRAVARIADARERQRQALGSVSLASSAETGIESEPFSVTTKPLSSLACGL